VLEVRYEDLARDGAAVAAALAAHVGAPAAELEDALGDAHAGSIGRYRAELSAASLADVMTEAGELLRELGYVA